MQTDFCISFQFFILYFFYYSFYFKRVYQMNFDQTRLQEVVGLQYEYWKFFHCLMEITNLGAGAPKINFEYSCSFVCSWPPIYVELGMFV